MSIWNNNRYKLGFNSYLQNVHITPRPGLDSDNPAKCPRCGSWLFRDGNDLACSLRCGWRECCYFGTELENVGEKYHPKFTTAGNI